MAEEKQRGRDPEVALSAAVAAARGIQPAPEAPKAGEPPLKPQPSRSGHWAWLRLPRRGQGT